MMPVNSNKRKGRLNPNSGKLGRSKFHSEKNMSCDGVYGNSRLMYAAASLVGCVVQVQVQNGNIFEGVLRTFSHQLDIVLETAHRVSPKCLPMKGISPTVSNLISSYPFEGGIFEKLVFKITDVILLQACNVDADYAVKDNFTDTAISKFNGQIKERELEPWEGAGSDSENNLALNIEDEDGKNGWDANDMFKLNAEKYGVKSSYDNSLQEYTVALTKKDTEEYKMQEAKAMKIAQEIETNSSYQSRIQLENGDEEDKFSAVVRPDDSIPSKYVLPQKRRNIPGLKRQQQTTTSSPIHVASSKPYTSLHTSSNIPNQPMQYPSLPTLEGPHATASFPNSTSPSSSSTSTTVSSVPKNRAGDDTVGIENSKILTESTSVENVSAGPGPTRMQVLCPPPQTLPPRIERRRENEKKFSKQKGRTDEIEEFKKFSTNFKLTEEKEMIESEEGYQAPDTKVEPTVLLANKIEKTKIDKDEDKSANVVKYSTLNPNAKEFVFNPNAKSFTPRSMSVTAAQPPMPVQPQSQPQQQQQQQHHHHHHHQQQQQQQQHHHHHHHQPPQRMQDQNHIMAVPPSQMMPSLPQPIFTAMAPQYVMQAAPVSMAITSPFAAASPMNQTQRFRKVPITMQHRHDITPSMHVAAATGQPILAPAGIPTPSQLTVQYTSPPGVFNASGPNQPGVGYPQMNFVVGPRVVSPQPVGVIPTSHSVSYCDTSHLPTHFIMSAHPGATHSAATTPHSLQQGQHSNHHPPQSQTPGIHPSPSPVHQVPPPHGSHSQPPTPTTVMYPGGGALGQHPLQAAAHHTHSQTMSHPMHQHHPGFSTGPQPVVLMQQQQPVPVSHHGHQAAITHHSLHMHSIHSQNHAGSHVGTATHLLPQMTIIPTSAAITSAPTPPYVQHP